MGSIRMQLVLYGLAVVSGSVIKPFFYKPLFEELGLLKESSIQKKFPSIGTPYVIPTPSYYTSESRKDCEDYLTEVLATQPHQGVFAVEEERNPKNPPTIDVIPVPPTLGPISIPEFPVLPQFNFPDAPSLPVFAEGTKPVTIPETLYLPPLSLPELPARKIVGEQGPIFVPENPALPTFSEENTSVFIPEAPVLPPFFLPKLPTRISVEQLASEPGFVICFHIDGKKIELIRPTIIPEAPVVQPFHLPELPVRIEEPSYIISDVPLPSKPEPLVIPKAPALNLSEVPVVVNDEEPEPIFIPEVPAPPTFVGEQQLIVIPKAPVLPPFSRPEFPITVIEKDPAPFWSPYPPSTLVVDKPVHRTFEGENKPFVIPEAPALPPQIIPIFPISVVPEEPTQAINTERPDLPSFIDEKTPDSIPEAPVLPPFSQPELPVSVIAGPAILELPALINEVKPLVIPQAPELSPLVLSEIPRVDVQEPIQAPVLPPRFFSVTPQHDVNAENPALPTFSEENTSVFIPEAPVLPPFFLPKLPTRISVEQLASEPGFVICFYIDGKKIELIRPMIIPEAPVVQPFPLPELPVRIEEPSYIISDVPLPSKPEPLVIPKAPALNLSEVPVGVNDEELEPIFIPEVPALPNFVGEQQLIVIPKAPVLPPFSRPEFPITVIAKAPAPFWSPYPPSTLVVDEPVHRTFEGENKPFVIPEAPALPPQFIPIFPISVVPEEPTQAINTERSDLPSFIDEKTPDSIPEAPVLPPFSQPELPVSVIAGSAIPELPAFINEVKPLVIPPAPELSPLVLSEIPRVDVQEPIQAPVLPPRFFPETPQHDVNAEPALFFSNPALSSSAIVVEAPVQIVVQGSRFTPDDCDTLCSNILSQKL